MTPFAELSLPADFGEVHAYDWPTCVSLPHLLQHQHPIYSKDHSILPSWTYGLWLSTSFLTSYDNKTVSGFLQGMQERNCPVRVFHFDCFWMKQYEW